MAFLGRAASGLAVLLALAGSLPPRAVGAPLAPFDGLSLAPAAASSGAGRHIPARAPALARQRLGPIPLSFEPASPEAPGSPNTDAVYIARAGRARLTFAPARVTLVGLPGRTRAATAGAAETRLTLTFPGSDASVAPEGLAPLPGVVNRLSGADPADWQIGLPTFGALRYPQLYPGINLHYLGGALGGAGRLKGEWRLAPGADPSIIRLQYGGDVERLSLDSGGALHVTTAAGELIEAAPESYQPIGPADGWRWPVASRYVLRGEREVGFALGPTLPGLPLVIDPALLWATYLGGGGADEANAIAVDAQGNVYITGSTTSANYPSGHTPVSAGPRPVSGRTPTDDINVDPLADVPEASVVVTKLNPAGTQVIYSTTLPGGRGDEGLGIVADAQGNAYVTGQTSALNFPATAGTYQPSYPGGVTSAFLLKLTPSGDLGWGTFLGGSDGEDGANQLALDTAGNLVLAGFAGSTTFPTTPGALQRTEQGRLNAFIAKLDPTGAHLLFSTYLGGNGEDAINGLAVDATGAITVAGDTTSTNFPTTPGAVQPSLAGGDVDGFVARLNPSGSALLFSTYLGGSADGESIAQLAVDGQGNTYVAGTTLSSDFPTTLGALVRGLASTDGDAFVAKLNATGSALSYSTLLGASGVSGARGLVVDGAGQATVVGLTGAAFPYRLPDAFDPTFRGGGVGFVLQLNAAGSGVRLGSYLGTDGDDAVTAITADAAGNLYLTGATAGDLPATPGVVQATYQGGASDIFVAKLSPAAAPQAAPVVPELPPLWLMGSGLLLLGGLAAGQAGQRGRRPSNGTSAPGRRARWRSWLLAIAIALPLVLPEQLDAGAGRGGAGWTGRSAQGVVRPERPQQSLPPCPKGPPASGVGEFKVFGQILPTADGYYPVCRYDMPGFGSPKPLDGARSFITTADFALSGYYVDSRLENGKVVVNWGWFYRTSCLSASLVHLPVNFDARRVRFVLENWCSPRASSVQLWVVATRTKPAYLP